MTKKELVAKAKEEYGLTLKESSLKPDLERTIAKAEKDKAKAKKSSAEKKGEH